MTSLHPNIELLGKLRGHIPDRLADVEDLFAKTFVWHYFNRHLPDLEGSYEGVDGLRHFFEKLSALTGGTFSLTVKDIKTIGDELLVAHARPAMTLGGDSIHSKPMPLLCGALSTARLPRRGTFRHCTPHTPSQIPAPRTA